jgi:hypothetical protein
MNLSKSRTLSIALLIAAVWLSAEAKPSDVGKLDALSRKLYARQVVDPCLIDAGAIERFDKWIFDYKSRRAAAFAEDYVQLARKRRASLKELIKKDPQAAWKKMLSEVDRQGLPSEVLGHIEEEISGTGDWETYAICFSNLPFDEYHEAVLDPDTSSERRFHSFGVGNLHDAVSKRGIILNGYVIDDIAVFDGESAPQTSGLGENISYAPGESETSQRDSLPLSGRQGGSDKGGQTLDYRTMLYMRIAFADDPNEVVQSESNAYSMMRSVNNHLLDASYGRMQVLATVTPIIVLPEPQSFYATEGTGKLGTDARAAATALGYSPGQYGHRVYRYSGSPGTFGGLATVSANPGNIWMRNSGNGVLVHEMGHNYKLMHSSGWVTNDKASIGPSSSNEYGHTFDLMGNAYGFSKGQFCSYQKDRLGWLKDSEFAIVLESGSFRIHSLDDGRVDPGKRYAVKIATEDRGNYWIEYRNNYTTNAFKNGALLQGQGTGWASSTTKPSRIDVTYWSSKDNDDSTIPLGWTFSDHEHGIHVTPIARDGNFEWIDLQVNRGFYPGNRPPVATLTADTNSVATDVKVNLSVVATDPDGDELAYHWYYDDNEWHGNRNKTSVSKKWSNAGIRAVICTVSDMKGGVTIKKIPISVGTLSDFTVSGRAVNHLGAPVVGAPVDNDLGKSNADYRSTVTDDEGYYMITRLPAGDYTFKCRKDYDVYNNDFSNPVTVDADKTGIDFTARLFQVTAIDSNLSEAGGSGQFVIERVGGHNKTMDLSIRLLGSAVEGVDYTLTPEPNDGQYNLVTNQPLAITVTAVNDVDLEGPEDIIFSLAMTNNSSVIGPNTTASLWIEDNDTNLPRVRLAAVDRHMPENGGTALARLTRYGSLDQPLTVELKTAEVAVYDTDYNFPGGTALFTIDANQSSIDVQVASIDDGLIEGTEKLKLSMKNGDYIKDPDQKTAVIRITDDDIPTVTIEAFDDTSSEPGANPGTVRFSRNGDTTDPLTIEYGVRGVALHGTDYAQLSGVATIAAGASYEDVAIDPLLDTFDESSETAKLRTACDNSDYILSADVDTTVDIFDGDNSPDINGDGYINFEDFEAIAWYWLAPCSASDWCQGADLNASELVDIQDMETLTQSWLDLP